MGIRRRGYDIAAFVRAYAADKAARDEATRVVELWNADLAAGRDIWWSPTIRAAIVRQRLLVRDQRPSAGGASNSRRSLPKPYRPRC
jgi:hypothetical protein